MDVLLIGNQPLLLESFVTFSQYSSSEVKFYTLENKEDRLIDAVLIDAKLFHGKTLRKLVVQYSNYPVFIMIENNKKGALFGVSGVAGVFNYDFSKSKIIKSIQLFVEPRSIQQNEVQICWKEEVILGYLTKGVSNKEIAGELGINLSAVKYYVRNLCHKMGVKNRVQAALKANEISV